MKVINLTQHMATPDQIAAGVINPREIFRCQVSDLLTFDDVPTQHDMALRAIDIAQIAVDEWALLPEVGESDTPTAMIGGAPFFMSMLEAALRGRGFLVFYAFSRRESVEVRNPDGTVTKTAVFRHAGFVEV